jgi:hypothetical protein
VDAHVDALAVIAEEHLVAVDGPPPQIRALEVLIDDGLGGCGGGEEGGGEGGGDGGTSGHDWALLVGWVVGNLTRAGAAGAAVCVAPGSRHPAGTGP